MARVLFFDHDASNVAPAFSHMRLYWSPVSDGCIAIRLPSYRSGVSLIHLRNNAPFRPLAELGHCCVALNPRLLCGGVDGKRTRVHMHSSACAPITDGRQSPCLSSPATAYMHTYIYTWWSFCFGGHSCCGGGVPTLSTSVYTTIRENAVV